MDMTVAVGPGDRLDPTLPSGPACPCLAEDGPGGRAGSQALLGCPIGGEVPEDGRAAHRLEGRGMRITVITGLHGSGKTTLARSMAWEEPGAVVEDDPQWTNGFPKGDCHLMPAAGPAEPHA